MAVTTKTEAEKSAFEYEYKKQYQDDWDIHSRYVLSFDPYEAMMLGQTYDSVSNSIDSSKITDSYTATLAIERAARVMGKLPDGVTEATKADQGAAALMDIIRQKHLYPNMNSQFPLDTKLELAQLYSDVYGYFPVFEDWNVSDTGYIGPDVWLWNPRNLVFQQGRTFFKDMEYITALTWVSKKFLQDIIDDATETDDGDENPTDDSGWDLDALRELVEAAGVEITTPDSQKDTQVERTRIAQASRRGICLATRYERGEEGEWITFAPDYGFQEVRRLKNPHKTGKIPFFIKYSQELYDSVYGLGEFQRSKPLQFARDGLTNFYFKGIKMNLIPPIVVNANGVLKHTIDYREGAVMQETIPNSIRRLETSTAGLATYQAAQSNLTGSLQTLWGSQSASMPGADTLNPEQGKTPAAIELYSGKEATRDGRARRRIEVLIEEITDYAYELIANIGTESIPVSLYTKDIEEIYDSGLTDVKDLLKGFKPNSTQTGGHVSIDPAKFKDLEFHFNINWGSTAKITKQEQMAEFETMMDDIAKFQNQFKDDPSLEVNWSEIMKARESISNIPGASKFVTMKSPEQVQQEQQQAAAAAAPPPPQPAPLQNPVQIGDNVHESADLAKMYVAPTTPDDVKNQILVSMGLQPSNMPSPATTDQAAKHAKIINDAALLDLAQKQHEQKVAESASKSKLDAHGHALDLAKAVDSQANAAKTHQLAATSAVTQANQATKTHELATKTAQTKPTKTAKPVK